MFYHLETWTGSTSDPYTTTYLKQIRLYQRQLTTAAFKIAGGVDLTSSNASSRVLKQTAVPHEFVTKVTKAFLDSLYAFLDGLVHLGSEDASPAANAKKPVGNAAAMTSNDPLALLDISDPVSLLCIYTSPLS